MFNVLIGSRHLREGRRSYILQSACSPQVCCCLFLLCLLRPLGSSPLLVRLVLWGRSNSSAVVLPSRLLYSRPSSIFCVFARTVLQTHSSIVEVLADRTLRYCSNFVNSRGVGSVFGSWNLALKVLPSLRFSASGVLTLFSKSGFLSLCKLQSFVMLCCLISMLGCQ